MEPKLRKYKFGEVISGFRLCQAEDCETGNIIKFVIEMPTIKQGNYVPAKLPKPLDKKAMLLKLLRSKNEKNRILSSNYFVK